MPSDVDICNRALANIGHTQFLEDLDPSDGPEGEVCAKFYSDFRDEVLRKYDWPFARWRVQPAPLDATTLALGAVPAPWAFAYAYPDQCLSVRKMVWVPASTSPAFSGLWYGNCWRGGWREYGNLIERYGYPYRIESDSALKKKVILSDAGDTSGGVGPTIIFTAQITDPTEFPDDFVDALAWRLSVQLALGIRKDPKLAKDAAAAYKAALDEATSAARTESPRPPMPPAPHILARR